MLSFDRVTELAEDIRAFTAVYDADGRMLWVGAATVLDGRAQAVAPLAAAERMSTARLFRLWDQTWAPVCNPTSLPLELAACA